MLQGRETALSHLFSSKFDVLLKRKMNSLHLEIDHHWQQLYLHRSLVRTAFFPGEWAVGIDWKTWMWLLFSNTKWLLWKQITYLHHLYSEKVYHAEHKTCSMSRITLLPESACSLHSSGFVAVLIRCYRNWRWAEVFKNAWVGAESHVAALDEAAP